MDIRNRAVHDPVADLYVTEAYYRWALLAAEEVVGKQGLNVILREAGLGRLVDNYPPDEPVVINRLTFGDYASLCAGLLGFYGRAGKAMLLRIGRLSARHSIEQQGALFGLAALAAIRLLPTTSQLKVGLENMQGGLRKLSQAAGQDRRLHLEDRGDRFAFVVEDCTMCAGKQSDMPICMIMTGALQEMTHWLTGKEFEIRETECRGMGAPACVWEVLKKPKE